MVDGKFASEFANARRKSGMEGWEKLWDCYRHSVKAQGINLATPYRLRKFVQATSSWSKVVSQQADVPIGFWPNGKHGNNICNGC